MSSLLIALVSYRFVPLGVPVAMEHMAYYLEGNALALYAHIGIAPIALAVMPFQFWGRLRARYLGLHRLLGRIYVAAILISGTAGLWLAFHSEAGTVAATGFALLALAWLVTTTVAFRHALSRKFDLHRRWMVRSAALTFAAVTLRLYLGVSLSMGADFALAYPVIAWACWLPNAIAAELCLRWPRSSSGHAGQHEPLAGAS
ncbi:MAG: hypothetical protein Tsb0019_37340 [Roseibium sp.]